jgi:hypothetical protein
MYILKNRALLTLVSSLAFFGCSNGAMSLKEVHYFFVDSRDHPHRNYYRMRIQADTVLGVADYRGGWFPSRNVDMLFGDVSLQGSTDALRTRDSIEQAVNSAVLKTTTNWLNEASSDAPSQQKLSKLRDARRLVTAYSTSPGAPFPGTREMDYNPARGVFVNKADDKFVFVLGSNPDDVVGKIAAFAEEDKTILSVGNLADIAAQRVRNDVAAQAAIEDVRQGADKLLASQIQNAVTVVATGDKKSMLQQVDLLLALLSSQR